MSWCLGSPRGHACLCSLRGIHQPRPDVPDAFISLYFLLSNCRPAGHLLGLSPSYIGSLPNTPFISFPCFISYTNKNVSFHGIIHFCYCFLLVRSEVVWEPNGLILPHGRSNGNWGPSFHFSPAPYINRNVGSLITKTAMTKTETWQTRPLVREGAPKRQDSNFENKKKSLVKSSRLGSTPRHTDWLTISRNVALTLTLTWLQDFVCWRL
jgi:hypothetical protein